MTDAQGTDSFDITGTSVSGLQNFLRDVPDTSVRDALEQLRPYCTGLSAAALSDMLVANAWEVDQIEVLQRLPLTATPHLRIKHPLCLGTMPDARPEDCHSHLHVRDAVPCVQVVQ